jgi:hypothetical protein
MLTGFDLEQKIKGLGYLELNAKSRRDFARMIIDRSRLFKKTDEESWKAAFQARTNHSQITLCSYPQAGTVDVKSVTKMDLMTNGLMKKSYEVTENYLIGVLAHPALDQFSETNVAMGASTVGRLRKRSFFSTWLFGRSKWRFVLEPKSPAPGAESAKVLAAVINFLNEIPVAETELSNGLFCFTHKHLEQHADIPKLATELKKLAASL